MLFRGVMINSLSGSLDGITASHNRGGAYLRSRTVPVDPNTVNQGYCRTAMANVDSLWRGLTSSERAAWAAYARGVEVTNRIGERRSLSPRNAFFKELLPRVMKNHALDAGDTTPIVQPPPAELRDFPVPPSVAYVDSTHVALSWPAPMGWEDTAADAGETGIILHLSHPQEPTIYWFRGPYIPAYWLEADEDTPPSPPQSVNLSTSSPTVVPALVSGKKYFWSLRLFWENRPNGRTWTGSFTVP